MALKTFVFAILLYFSLAMCPDGSLCSCAYNATFQCPCNCVPCRAGMFCPPGSTLETNNTDALLATKICPPGFFCPNTYTVKECEEGYFCPAGSTSGHKCAVLTSCPSGSKQPSTSYMGTVLLIAAALAYFFSYQVYFFFRRRREVLFVYDKEFDELSHKAFEALKEIAGKDKEVVEDKNVRVKIGFKDMSVTIGEGKSILYGVNGCFRPGRMCAVMGPSGAGKSTLLTAMLGLNSGKVGGTITVNGTIQTLESFKSLVAFVPQDDIVIPELTVKDNLWYSASWRLPSHLDYGAKVGTVSKALRMLQLEHVKDTVVGDAEHRGISGGQKKRVNIGLELVSRPSVLFLDEPTSGLDSTSSLQILSALKSMAQSEGMTIAAVIHQPRISIFNMFDDVLLLAKGGRTVYIGPTTGVIPYFEQNGYRVPDMENPADFIMDVIAGDIKTFDGRDPPDLVKVWEERGPSQEQIDLPDAATMKPVENRIQAPFHRQWLVFFRRSVNQFQRRPMDLLIDVLLVIVGGVGCGAVFGPNGKWNLKTMETVMLFSSVVLGLLSCMSSLKVFGSDRLFFFRECTAGINVLSYFLAKVSFALSDVVVRPLLYGFIIFSFLLPFQHFSEYYSMQLLVAWYCSGLGYLISVVVNPRNALLAAVVFPFILGLMFAGLAPSPKEFHSSGLMHFISHFAYGNWVLQALVLIEYKNYPESLKTLPGIGAKEFLEERGYDLDEKGITTAVMALFALGLGFRILAFIVMYATTPQNRVVSKFVEYIVTKTSDSVKTVSQTLKPKPGELEKPLVSNEHRL